MITGSRLFLFVCICLVSVDSRLSTLYAQTEEPQTVDYLHLRIQTDQLILKSGEVRSGLITLQNANEVELLEIERPPGKPAFILVRVYPVSTIQSIKRISAEEAKRLKQMADRIRDQVQIEAKALQQISLLKVERAGKTYLRFADEGFTLLSELEQQLTKKFAVKIDQVYRAFRNVIPQHAQRKTNLTIIIFESQISYRNYLNQLGFTSDNPALFLPQQNSVLISTDLQPFYQQFQTVNQQHQSQRDSWNQKHQRLNDRLNELSKNLKGQSLSQAEIKQEIAFHRGVFLESKRSQLQQIETADRKNQRQLNQLITAATRRLIHETFHAYLENQVIDSNQTAMPLWLNEGLAQIFEHGQIDGGRFRIEPPPKELFQRVYQANQVRTDSLFLLDDLPDSFLPGHASYRQSLEYDTAWAFTWYLVSQHQLLNEEKLTQLLFKKDQQPERASVLKRIKQITKTDPQQLKINWSGYLRRQANL